MSFLKSKRKEECSGCEGCRQICPMQCISMIIDSEGFCYPEIDITKCIQCNRCIQYCDSLAMQKSLNFEQVGAIGIHKDKEVLQQSSSGGAFTAICQWFANSYRENCIYFGCVMHEDYSVKYQWVSSIDDIGVFRKSKYAQVETGDTYQIVESFLKAGKVVLFSGTPCVIAALKGYLGIEYSNLLCVDIVCHGAPNYRIFQSYIDLIESKKGTRIKKYNFRNKEKFNNEVNTRTAYVEYANGSKEILLKEKDCYLKGYYNRLFYRLSCKYCKYANSKRYGDLTIMDAWGFEGYIKGIEPIEGVSAVICNSKKGYECFEQLRNYMDIIRVPVNDIIQKNEQLTRPTQFHHGRKRFFAIYSITNRLDISVFLSMLSVKSLIKKVLPKRVCNLLRSIYKK